MDEDVTTRMSRIDSHTRRGAAVTIIVDGVPIPAYRGESIAAALLASGRRALRVTPKLGAPRGLFCGMGVCFECMVKVGGGPSVRACMTPVDADMRIDTGTTHDHPGR